MSTYIVDLTKLNTSMKQNLDCENTPKGCVCVCDTGGGDLTWSNMDLQGQRDYYPQ